jgi:hypothetical protein
MLKFIAVPLLILSIKFGLLLIPDLGDFFLFWKRDNDLMALFDFSKLFPPLESLPPLPAVTDVYPC